MVRAKARISYRDTEDDDDAASEASDDLGEDSDDLSDAPPVKKVKKNPVIKKKGKKVKKVKKSKYTDDSDDEIADVEDLVSDDETAPATWRPGGPVVEAKKPVEKDEYIAPITVPVAKKPSGGGVVYKDASDHDFTDDGEIEDAADSDFDVAAPKKRAPAKRTPAKKAKKPPAARKKSAAAAASPKKNVKATNGAAPRTSGRAGGKPKAKYTETDDEEEDEEEEEESEEEAPLTKRKQKVAKVAKGRGEYLPKGQRESQLPAVSEMVQTAIRGLKAHPRKSSSLPAIKSFMVEEWGINPQDYALKIKKYIVQGVEKGELTQTKGK